MPQYENTIMTMMTVAARGQAIFRRDVLQHLGMTNRPAGEAGLAGRGDRSVATGFDHLRSATGADPGFDSDARACTGARTTTLERCALPFGVRVRWVDSCDVPLTAHVLSLGRA